MQKLIKMKAVALIGIAAIVLFVLLMLFAPAFAMWGEAMVVIFAFLAVLYAVDVWGLRDIDLVKEIIDNGNGATAILVSAIIIAFSIIVHGFATR